MPENGIAADFSPFRPFGRHARLSGDIRRLAAMRGENEIIADFFIFTAPPTGRFFRQRRQIIPRKLQTRRYQNQIPAVIYAICPAIPGSAVYLQSDAMFPPLRCVFYIGKSASLKYIFQTVRRSFTPASGICSPLIRFKYPHPFAGRSVKFRFTNFASNKSYPPIERRIHKPDVRSCLRKNF